MRKNRMMRAASALLVAVLLTTSTISGTFAKYVTEASAQDEARVAKWGVQIDTEGDGYFTTTYADENADSGFTNTVVSDVKVVAPGTNDEGNAFFKISGQPEVAVQVKVEVTGKDGAEKATDVVLAAGEYWDWTKAPYTTKFTVAKEYHPIVFTLTKNSATVKTGTLADIEAYLEGAEVSKNYPAGTDLSTELGEYQLSWSWAFEQSADKEDTLLGNIAAGIDTAAGNTSTALYLAIKVTVTQID